MSSRRGFTIIELLATLVLLASLSAIAVPRYRGYKTRAYLAAMKTDLGTLRIAEESHWAEHQQYATDTTALDFHATSDVRIALSSQDLIGGYTAIATHRQVPGMQCSTATGQEAVNQEAGSIVCGPATGGSGTLSSTTP